MKINVKLDGPDIAKVLAEHFGVKASDVNLRVEKEYEGYGPMEHEVLQVRAEVKLPEDRFSSLVKTGAK